MKGKISEIFSKARFSDDISLYTVEYRDMDDLKEISLSDYLERKETDDPIPEHRIQFIKRSGIILYEKSLASVRPLTNRERRHIED